MSADERIQALLDKCGQTMEDLPQSYDFEKCQLCRNQAGDWAHNHHNEQAPLTQYACHMADLIDRMELALENEHMKRMDLEVRIGIMNDRMGFHMRGGTDNEA